MNIKSKKKLLLGILIPIAVLLLTVISYLLYVVCTYSRVEDKLSLAVLGESSLAAPVGEELSLVTYNIGFGAYSDDYSFFMDGGEYSRAFSKAAVLENTRGALDTALSASPDFVLLQEVDKNGTRSYHVDQTALAREALSSFDGVYAQNYDSAYLFYPFSSPIGANESGLMTFSRFGIKSALRRSLPIEQSLYKFLDLDRAYTLSRIPTENGKTLVLYNVHLSAYTSDGSIADEQLSMLSADMAAEYALGNYVLAAGDFNKDLLGDSGQYFERTEGEFTWAKPIDLSLLPDGFSCLSGQNRPTCRNADSPFRGDGTDFVLSVDGMLISPNIELISCETLDAGFRYSDHNPVVLVFSLAE